MYIHQYPHWPKFSWNAEKLTLKLSSVRHRQGLLLGKMEGLGFDFKREASLQTLTNDIVKSSAIEGELLHSEEVRSSIARRLGLNIAGLVPSPRDVEGIVEMMLDATQKFQQPLTPERLFGWHSVLFPSGRSGMHSITVGAWRKSKSDPMQVVSGALGQETVHFEAPSADRLEQEMSVFLQWFEGADKMDPVLKAGIAHLWFVTIHPFEDGNGRIARAIADMALARADGMADRFYSLSTQMERERKDYYRQLELQQRSEPEITGWLDWFLDCLDRSLESAEQGFSRVLVKSKFWGKINQQPVNERQRLVINRMLEEDFKGNMNTSKYAKLAKCSNDTALRDIQELKNRGILIQNDGGGRSTSYRLTEEIL
jgi:Fic family protein